MKIPSAGFVASSQQLRCFEEVRFQVVKGRGYLKEQKRVLVEGMWLFGGIFEVLERKHDRYRVRLSRVHQEFAGRLMVQYPGPGARGGAFFLEKHYNELNVTQIFEKPSAASSRSNRMSPDSQAPRLRPRNLPGSTLS